MTFDPKTEGFEWPEETVIENASGAELTVCPAVLRACCHEEADERERECYRLYETDMGLLSELEIKHWQTGGFQEEEALLDAYHAIFSQPGERKPVCSVLQTLLNQGFPEVQIRVVVGWLIKGQYVGFDPGEMTITDCK